ncbi:MAG: ABC transporter ATP-binding protein, partial [Salinisphaera sp.]|nr:ABC transporter ATP-binding protein [Salinisphaera sp.]
LSGAQRRELRALPDRIEELEAKIRELEATMAQSGFYDQAPTLVSEVTDAFSAAQSELDRALTRWEMLENAGA